MQFFSLFCLLMRLVVLPNNSSPHRAGLVQNLVCPYAGWSISYRKYILQITQPSQYRYSKLQYRFAVFLGHQVHIILHIFTNKQRAQNSSLRRMNTQLNKCIIQREAVLITFMIKLSFTFFIGYRKYL